MKDKVIMKISGPEVDLFCRLDSNLEKFMTMVKAKKVLNVQLDKAMYGCVQSALLLPEDFQSFSSKASILRNKTT